MDDCCLSCWVLLVVLTGLHVMVIYVTLFDSLLLMLLTASCTMTFKYTLVMILTISYIIFTDHILLIVLAITYILGDVLDQVRVDQNRDTIR